MDLTKWQPFWDIRNMEFFYSGFKLTIGLAAVSIFLSLVFGIVLALMRTSGWRILSIPAYLYTHALRNSPLILIIFFTYFALPKVGLSLSPFWPGPLFRHQGLYPKRTG